MSVSLVILHFSFSHPITKQNARRPTPGCPGIVQRRQRRYAAYVPPVGYVAQLGLSDRGEKATIDEQRNMWLKTVQ